MVPYQTDSPCIPAGFPDSEIPNLSSRFVRTKTPFAAIQGIKAPALDQRGRPGTQARWTQQVLQWVGACGFPNDSLKTHPRLGLKTRHIHMIWARTCGLCITHIVRKLVSDQYGPLVTFEVDSTTLVGRLDVGCLWLFHYLKMLPYKLA